MNNIGILQKALDAASLRQQVISNNIANADTPGYKAKQVVFEDILKQHLTNQTNFSGSRTNPRHIAIGTDSIPDAEVTTDTTSVMQNNGNNVDIDEQMTQMGKNSLWYYTLTEQLNSEFKQLDIAIKGRS